MAIANGRTRKDCLLIIKDFISSNMPEGDDKTDVLDYVDNQLRLLQKRRDEGIALAEEKKEITDAIVDEIYNLLDDEDWITADELTEALSYFFPNITKSKVCIRVGKLIKEGIAEKGHVEAYGGKRVAYKLVEDEE